MQAIYPFQPGAVIYHDWSELVVTEMPDTLKGHVLLPTIRGRAREAQLIGAFRKTPHPSSNTPDMVVLTWSDDPKTTQTIQWRVNAANETAYQACCRIKDSATDAPWTCITSTSKLLSDRNIFNDSKVRWHTATLTDLSPGHRIRICNRCRGRETWSAPGYISYGTCRQHPADVPLDERHPQQYGKWSTPTESMGTAPGSGHSSPSQAIS